jgi:hypothetical protein
VQGSNWYVSAEVHSLGLKLLVSYNVELWFKQGDCEGVEIDVTNNSRNEYSVADRSGGGRSGVVGILERVAKSAGGAAGSRCWRW